MKPSCFSPHGEEANQSSAHIPASTFPLHLQEEQRGQQTPVLCPVATQPVFAGTQPVKALGQGVDMVTAKPQLT